MNLSIDEFMNACNISEDYRESVERQLSESYDEGGVMVITMVLRRYNNGTFHNMHQLVTYMAELGRLIEENKGMTRQEFEDFKRKVGSS